MKLTQQSYSFRNDPMVPDFKDTGMITVMDARCGLCAKGARWIARNDKPNKFRIIPIQSELGAALFYHYGMAPEDPDSWLYIAQGRAYCSADAVIRVAQELGGVWKNLQVLRVFPEVFLDYCYDIVARNRIMKSGKADLCALPAPEIQRRLLQ